jgi:cobalt-zinc-cadmium efflux system membrane fusion protein
MFVVADLSRVWVVADVPEQQSASIQLGQQVEIEVPSLGRTLTGRIVHVASFVDPQTRTVMARCELDNRSGELKPAMLANLLIQTNRRRDLVVPASGVLRENNRDHVYVQKSPGVFVLTPVELGPSADRDLRPVRSGLSAGQKIVIDGAFHLNNERIRNAQS